MATVQKFLLENELQTPAKLCFPQTEENNMPTFQQDGAPGLKVLITILNVQLPGH